MTASREQFGFSNNGSDKTEPSESSDYYLEYDNPVRDGGIVHIGKPEKHSYVTYHKHAVTMENGSRYLVTTTEIPDRLQGNASDIPSIETTAWLTQPDGMNKRRMAELAKLAIPSIFVSIQQNVDRFGKLANNAHNEVEIAKAMADIYDFDPEHSLTQGISRGAMTSLAVTAIARQHNMNVMYADAIVPCFPNGINLGRDLLEYLNFFPNETNSLRALIDIPFKYLRHYPKTLDLNLFQQLKEVPTLLSGEVGNQIQRNMSPDTFGHTTVYKGDVMSQGSRWQQLLNPADYPNMVLDVKDGGGHLSCTGNDSFTEWQGRLHTISEILHEDPSNRFIGGTALRALAAERNDTFLQPDERESFVVISKR